MGIQDKINEETEAYNKRATAIIFNIQQQAILAAVQSGQITDAGAASQAITELAYSYGLVDEKTKAVADSTQSAINQFAATGNLEVFDQQLRNIEQSSQEAAPTIKNTGEIAYHTGERASDAAIGLMEMRGAQSELASGLNKEANPAAAELKKSITSLPPSGSVWNYAFNISVTGRVPRLPTRGTESGPGAGQENNAGNQADDIGVSHLWTGGDIGNGWQVVGDAPGGGWGPYTEAVFGNHVFDAKTSRKLRDAGILDGAMPLYYGSDGPGVFTPGNYNTSGQNVLAKRKRNPGSRVGGGAAGASGDAASDAAAGVAGFVVPAIQSAVQQASGLNTQVAANSQQQSGYLSQMVDLLTQLVNNQPTATQTAKATSVEQSRFS
jgi:hypothetical protein